MIFRYQILQNSFTNILQSNYKQKFRIHFTFVSLKKIIRMKKSFLNVFAVVAISALALTSCNKTKKAVEEVKENTQEVAQETSETLQEEMDTVKAELDTLNQKVDAATSAE